VLLNYRGEDCVVLERTADERTVLCCVVEDYRGEDCVVLKRTTEERTVLLDYRGEDCVVLCCRGLQRR
jgi:hypothetical protein